MSEHEEVYLGGHRNKYNYSYALYYGPQDPRNMSQRCNPIVIDNDGAELEAVVHYLEALSSQPKRDRTHPYIVKMSSVKTLNWILIYIPACRTYGWVHPETGERVVYEPILRYLDALLLYLRSDGTALIFAFVPPRAVLPAIDQLAKTATKIVLREWEALCYNTCVRTVHALTGPGYSASPQQIKEAFDAMTHAQTRMSVGEQRAGKKANLGSSEKPKGPGRMQQAPGPSTAPHASPRQQPKAAITSGTHRVNLPGAPRSLDAPVRSSEKWMKLIKSGDGQLGTSARVFAELCEDVVPNFVQSKVKWPWITADMRSGIEERLSLLQESWENLHAPSAGQKRAHPSSSNGSPAKKQKTSAWSRQTDSIDFSEHSKFLDEFTFTVTSITRRLRNQILGKAEPLRFIVVFRNDYEDRKPYTAIDHLPHLIAAANQGSKKKIKLVTFPKSFEKRFSEILHRRGQFEQCDFALEKKTYAHDEELIKLLKTVPTLKPDSDA